MNCKAYTLLICSGAPEILFLKILEEVIGKSFVSSNILG